MKDFQYITRAHPSYIENLYNDFVKDPASVDGEMRKFFEGFDFAVSSADAENTDTTSVRADFAVLIYPVISFDSTITHKGSRNNLIGAKASAEQTNYFSNELQVDSNTSPSFIVHAGDDRTVPVDNSIRYYQACIKNKVSVEMHLYPKGGHGFGMYNKTTTDNWLERLHNWLESFK